VLSGNFFSNKGKLPYPLKGNYKLVSTFGEYKDSDPNLIRVDRRSDGIDIQTTKGNTACAVFDGVVSIIFVIPGGSQNAVMIRHGNYISVYGNLVNLLVKKGDNISAGQALGTIYTDDKGTILHFEIREESKKMNPLSWLR